MVWWIRDPGATGKMAGAKSAMKRGWVLQSHLSVCICEYTHAHARTHTHMSRGHLGWLLGHFSGGRLIRPATVTACQGKKPQTCGLLWQKGALAERRAEAELYTCQESPSV